MIVRWDTPPHNKSEKCQVTDIPGIGRYMVKFISRGEYRIFLNNKRTNYAGDNMSQAKAIAESLINSFLKRVNESG